MKLLKNADVYSPKYLGKKDILLEGMKIVEIADEIANYENIPNLEVIDLKGKKVVPGYIDSHVHITGGGGEQGPASRTPEATIGELLECGVTTVVGLLGTDGISRSLENLLFKARALDDEGITAYILTGSYTTPPVTLTGDVERDITLIDKIIGVKTAVSDHRSSNPTAESLIELGTLSRRAGLLSNKAGLVVIHMGIGKKGLQPLFDAIENSDIPVGNFLPTHINLRSHKLLDDGIKLISMGGNIDFTCYTTEKDNGDLAEKIKYCLDKGAKLSNITLSTDGYGSMPKFDDDGKCIGITYGKCTGLHTAIKALVNTNTLSLENALTLVTSNVARILAIESKKGKIDIGFDADMIVYDENFEIDSVIAKGEIAIYEKNRYLMGTFEL